MPENLSILIHPLNSVFHRSQGLATNEDIYEDDLTRGIVAV
jgi:hypothetical protein